MTDPASHDAGDDAFARASADLSGATAALRRLADSADVGRAARLAREGRLVQAEAILASASGSPHALDLRARVCAQARRYDDARRCWLRLAKAEPGSSAAAAGLRRLESASRSVGGSASVFVRIACILGITAVAVGVVAIPALLGDLWTSTLLVVAVVLLGAVTVAVAHGEAEAARARLADALRRPPPQRRD